MYIARMYVDSEKARQKIQIEVISIYSLGEHLIGCKKKKNHQGDTAQDDSWTVFRELGGPSVKKGTRKTGSGKPSKSLQFPPLSPMTPLSPYVVVFSHKSVQKNIVSFLVSVWCYHFTIATASKQQLEPLEVVG